MIESTFALKCGRSGQQKTISGTLKTEIHLSSFELQTLSEKIERFAFRVFSNLKFQRDNKPAKVNFAGESNTTVKCQRWSDDRKSVLGTLSE